MQHIVNSCRIVFCPTEQHIDEAANRGQRRAQLVRGVRDELAHALLRGGLRAERALDARDHLVKGVGEMADLVAAVGQADALGEIAARDTLRGRGHPRERTQRLRGEWRADDDAEQQRRADQDQQDQVQAGEGGADRVVVADDLDEAVAMRWLTHCEAVW